MTELLLPALGLAWLIVSGARKKRRFDRWLAETNEWLDSVESSSSQA